MRGLGQGKAALIGSLARDRRPHPAQIVPGALARGGKLDRPPVVPGGMGGKRPRAEVPDLPGECIHQERR